MPRPNGAAIKAIREAQGWKVNRLASAAGISRPHLSNIEGGNPNRYASVEVLHRLAKVLRVPYAALISDFSVEDIAGDDTDADQHVCSCGRAG